MDRWNISCIRQADEEKYSGTYTGEYGHTGTPTQRQHAASKHTQTHTGTRMPLISLINGSEKKDPHHNSRIIDWLVKEDGTFMSLWCW